METVKDVVNNRERFMELFTEGLQGWKDIKPSDSDYELFLFAQAMLRIFLSCKLLTDKEVKVLEPLSIY